jgi:osmoprotectant transport system permease protein
MPLLTFWAEHRAELVRMIGEHVWLVLLSTSIAALIGVPVGVLAAKRPAMARPLLAIAGTAQTVPSLALFGFLLPLPFIGGVGPRTALVTLTIYALLPVIRGTIAGIRSIDRSIVDAGLALGMSPRQLLRMVELPLAAPSIIGGVRVAAVIGVGTATIAAAIGAGGLGELIFRGLSMVDTTMILAGAVPAAGLALLADGALAGLDRRVRRRRRRPIAAVGLVALGLAALLSVGRSQPPGIVVGSKNFTEQILLGELIAQALEAEGMTVQRKLNLGGTFICDRALRAGDVDVYVEYTGTAVSAIYHDAVPPDSAAALARARERYARDGVTVTGPLGFNNTFAILVRNSDARALGLRSIADLARVQDRFTPGFGYEFLQRADGYPGLVRRYGLAFARAPVAMDVALIYKALADRQVDVIAGDATSALIDALELTPLDDTLQYFPPYDAVPVVRTPLLLERPELHRALTGLSGRITVQDMRAMNRAVDVERRAPAEVVRSFVNATLRGR